MWHKFRDRNLYQIFVKFRETVFHNWPSNREFCKIWLHDSQILPGAWNEFLHTIFIFIVRFGENFNSKSFFHIVAFGSCKLSEILCSENYILLHEIIKTFPEICIFFIWLRTNSIKGYPQNFIEWRFNRRTESRSSVGGGGGGKRSSVHAFHIYYLIQMKLSLRLMMLSIFMEVGTEEAVPCLWA